MDPRKRLSGGYVCERELGRGGQGVVWLARDRTGRQVLVKFLLPGMEYDEVALARVRREFGAASRVGELATARVLDADLSGQHPCIVSEFVQGLTIQQHVAAIGPLPSGRLQSLGLAVTHALAQVHRVGVVHRDVVELAVNGTRVAAYTGNAFDARGCGVAAFRFSATDPRGTACHAGFERFTVTELSARRLLLTKLSSKLLTISGSGSGSRPTVWDSYEPHSQTCPRRRRGGAQVRL
ncbi:hypothetical protein OG407_07985 [Streptomyces sp. NBC_01515]|uniref:protein kinase domain-containing protein n=1 Tax=Streptomyces sp. NBC_01515 TaxID=2903890 RepID=UPI00386EB9E8